MANSQPHSGPLTVEQMAEDARALLDCQGWASAHVVGHSLGGLIALQLALDAPRRVRSLALLCTFASGADAAPLTPWMMWTGLRTRIGTRRMRRHAFLKLVMPSSVLAMTDWDGLAENLAPVFGHDLGDLPPIVNAQLKAMRACNLTPRLVELANLPTLVVSAEHDRLAPPEAGQAIVEIIIGATYLEIADAAPGSTRWSCQQPIGGALRKRRVTGLLPTLRRTKNLVQHNCHWNGLFRRQQCHELLAELGLDHGSAARCGCWLGDW